MLTTFYIQTLIIMLISRINRNFNNFKKFRIVISKKIKTYYEPV